MATAGYRVLGKSLSGKYPCSDFVPLDSAAVEDAQAELAELRQSDN